VRAGLVLARQFEGPAVTGKATFKFPPLIHEDMTVNDLMLLLRKNKIKVAAMILAIAIFPSLYDDWSASRSAEKLKSDRDEVGTQASIAGMMLFNAWKSCTQIGISDISTCSRHEGQLLQEKPASLLAKTAVEQRDSYLKHCQRFYDFDYCKRLLERSIQISSAQSKK
jgi:hypothetical protein